MMDILTIIWWIVFIAIIIALLVIMVLVSMSKQGYKKTAYRLLKEPNPGYEEMKATIKGLNMHVGWIFKDEEVKALLNRLVNKLN